MAIGFDDSGYIYANDPNKSQHPRKQQQDKFKSCLKKAFIFWPKKLENTNNEDNTIKEENKISDETKQQTTEQKVKVGKGTEIVDISKWQGNVDFGKLSKKVAFVIARASCGSDKDIKFDEYAKAMQANGIPFGVYCYSYAGTEAKAKDEAQKIVKYANGYNPLFYVMDAEEERISKSTIKAFAEELRNQGCKKIGCYVANNRYDEYKYDTLRSLFDFTWIPRYGSNDGTIEGSTKPKYLCDLWQYTSAGKIDGINGKIDMNVITGDGHDLNWFVE